MTNRTLQFLGLAYGNSAVTVTATIDNVVVYNNTVATLNEPLVNDGTQWTTTNQLFAVENSNQFPTDFAGARTMSVSVTGGEGIILTSVLCNYMDNDFVVDQTSTMLDAAINGTTLTIGSVSSGRVLGGQVLTGSTIMPGTYIVSGSDLTWIVNNSQSVLPTTITGTHYTFTPGNATGFVKCYYSKPINSEGTPDCRSSVVIDGVVQVPPNPPSFGVWSWPVYNGSTLTCNLNVSVGNVA